MYKKVINSILLICIHSICFGQEANPIKLKQLISQAEATNSEALIVYQNNQLVTESYFGIGKPEVKIEAMSSTKSIVGLAVACLLTDGLIENLDVPVHQFYPEWNQGQKKEITIRHLVHMTSGIQNVPNAGLEIYPSPDFVKLALAAELSSKPGEVFSYNNKSLNLMAGLIEKITGKRMDKYIGERLFKPLEIIDFSWTLDDAGNPHVMAGCQIRPKDFVKIGLLLLNNGQYNGKQVISEGAIQSVKEPCEKFKAYGMLWWLDYERTTSIIDDEIIDEMRSAEVNPEFVDQVKTLKGRYESQNELVQKMQEVFGPNPWPVINQNLASGQARFRKREYSGNVSYRADGYLGNFIIVDPKNQIVAIRMISHESHNNPQDNFTDFKNLVLQLTDDN